MEISKPPKERKCVSYRKIRNINMNDLTEDLIKTNIVGDRERPLDDCAKLYMSELSNVLDQHAPLITKNLILRPNTEWYTDQLRAAKTDRRKAERRMRKTNLTIDRQIFQQSCITSNRLLLKCKNDFFL